MKITHLLYVTAALALSACSGDGTERSPPTDVRMVHAAPSYETLAFLREERVEGTLEYGGSIGKRFDSGEYDFHLEFAPAGLGIPLRAFTFTGVLSPDRHYTFVAVAPTGAPEVMVVSTEKPVAGSTTGRFTLIHANPGLAPVDVYLEIEGTVLSGALKRGTIAYGPDAAVFNATPNVYHLYLTPENDPATVLFESTILPVDAGSDTVLVVSGPGEQGLTDIVVSRAGNNAGRISQVGLGSALRVVQATNDRIDRDILVDGESAPPLFPAQPFGIMSEYLPLDPGDHILTVTPVATPGTAEAVTDFVLQQGFNYLAVVTGDPTVGLATRVFGEDRRRIAAQATLRVLNAAGLFGNVNVYIRPPGTDINTVVPSVTFMAPNITTRLGVIPGDYEVTVQDATTLAILAGPEPVTMVTGGVYGILLLNAASASTVDLGYFYDFAP